MMDDVLVCSCLVLAANAEGREIKTIESVAEEVNFQMSKKHLLTLEQFNADFAHRGCW